MTYCNFFGFSDLQFFISEKGESAVFSLRLLQTCETVSLEVLL